MTETLTKPMLIDGEDVVSSEPPVTSVNPATGQTNHRVHTAGPAEIDRAVASASRAAALVSWRGMLPPQRAAVLHRIGELMLRDAEKFALLQRIENGKVHAECMVQVRSAAATFRYYASVCETLESAVTPSRGNYLSMAVYEPYGVVVAITPWNSPMTMEAQKVAPALAAGNAVILKPSELTPSPALLLGRIALEAGLPPGLLNVLPGTGLAVGSALVAHAGVKMVSFTGGTASGRRIAGVAAGKLMPVALELGGKSPHIVFADADLDAAAEAVAGGIFEGSGQSCVAGSRLFVQRDVYARFVEKLVAKARGVKLGLPDRHDSKMGPIASFAHRAHIAAMVDAARDAGAAVLVGGEAPRDAALAAGAFYLPTVIEGVSNRSDIARNEIFGPVICAMPFDNEEDLVAQANDSVFGLAAGIWTRDFPRAWRVARALEAGTVWVNTYKQLSIATPFGGFKDSGLGREKGTGGLRLYQQAKGIYFGLDA